jgi:hypothetical protein
MRKILYITLANIIFLFHCIIGFFILTGWYFSQISSVYRFFLLIWLACWLVLGYCPITKWEFSLRRKYDPTINPHNEAIQHYMKKFFNIDISTKAILKAGLIIFIICMTLSFSRAGLL